MKALLVMLILLLLPISLFGMSQSKVRGIYGYPEEIEVKSYVSENHRSHETIWWYWSKGVSFSWETGTYPSFSTTKFTPIKKEVKPTENSALGNILVFIGIFFLSSIGLWI